MYTCFAGRFKGVLTGHKLSAVGYDSVVLADTSERCGLKASPTRCIPQGTSINWFAPPSSCWPSLDTAGRLVAEAARAEITLGARGWKAGVLSLISLSLLRRSLSQWC